MKPEAVSFVIPKDERAQWVTFIAGEYYPDSLNGAKIIYRPILRRYRQLLQQCGSSEELLRTIAKEPGKTMIQLTRIFRRYVSPDTSVEMLKHKTEIDSIIRSFGYRFRPIEEVRKAFASRPEEDEAMIALLQEYATRGRKGYTLTDLFFEWFDNTFGTMFQISGPRGAGKDIYLPDILPAYLTSTPTDFIIADDKGTLFVIGFARYDVDRGGAQEDDRTGGYNRTVTEVLQYTEDHNMALKILFINDGPGLLLGSMWDDYASLEKGREDKVMVCTLKMLEHRLTEDWIRS